jgi:hypothetical protein
MDTCKMTVDVKSTDDYYCLEEIWDEVFNFFQFNPDRYEVEGDFGVTYGEVSGQICHDPQVDGFNYPMPPGGDDYNALTSYTMSNMGAWPVCMPPGDFYGVTIDYTWITQALVVPCVGGAPYSPPIGTDWNLVADECATAGTATFERKPVTRIVYEKLFAEIGGDDIDIPGGWFGFDQVYNDTVKSEKAFPIIGETFPNGVLFNDFLINFLGIKCGLTVISDFFNINPDATAPANTPYQYAANLHDLVIFQKSDVKRPNDAEPAWKMEMTFKEFLEAIKYMFNIRWKIEGTDFRIEHISYWQNANGLDFTASPHDNKILGRHFYEYEASRFATKKESFFFMEAGNIDFIGAPITYNCLGTSEKSYNVDFVTTDVEFINSSDADTDDQVSDEGIVIMATYNIEGTRYLNVETGALSGDSAYNGHLSWANLHDRYHRHGREFLNGTMNEQDETFETAIRKKKQEEVLTVLCCAEIQTFDPSDLIKTQIDWGEVKKATWSGKTGAFKVQLLHD